MSVIAEGVEAESQRAFPASSGCQAFQGYFFSRSVPLEGFEMFARRVSTSASKLLPAGIRE